MIKALINISLSVIRSNKALFMGLSFLYILAAAILVIVGVLPPSIEASVYSFFEEYNLPQASIITTPSHIDKDELLQINNIENVDINMALESPIKYGENEKRIMRFFSIEDEAEKKFYIQKEKEPNGNNTGVWITEFFALYNNLNIGDIITIETKNKPVEVEVTGLVSTPDSIKCCRDETFWYEGFDFGFIYINRNDFDTIFNTTSLSNYVSLYFNDNCSYEDQSEALNNANDVLSKVYKSSSLYEDSEAKKIMNTNITTIKTVSTVMPGLIYLVIIVCSCLFFSQIINKQKRNIAIFKSIGYSNTKILISLLFVVVFLIIISYTFGGLIGTWACYEILEVYKSIFSLPVYKFIIEMRFIWLLLILLFAGILSVLYSIKRMINIDPSLVISGSHEKNRKTTKLHVKNTKHIYLKISRVLLSRNISRYVISAICLALCIILTIASIEGIHAKDVSDNSTFEQRLNYDALVFYAQGNKSLDSIKEITGVDQAEQVGISTGTLVFDGQEQKVQVNAIQNNSQLITPRDKDNNILSPENGIIIEEYLANAFGIKIGDFVNYEGKQIEVTEIAREFIHPIQYISLETASSLEIESNNAATIKINPTFDSKDIYNKIYEANGVEYIKFVENQHENRGVDMQSIYIIYYLLCIACLVIGVVTVFNMIRIKIGETIYEYSTLMSIGTKYSAIRLMAIYENILQYLLAVFIAIVPAYFVTKLILDKQSSFRGSYPIVDLPQVYLIALCLCLVYVILGVAYTMFRVYRLKLSETINIAE